MFVALPIAFGAAASWLLLRLIIPQLRCKFLDQPNARSSHRKPTPSGGGVVFVSLSIISSLVTLVCGLGLALDTLPLLAAPLAVVGLLDDRHNLRPSLRFGAQLFTAALIVGLSSLVQGFMPALAAGNVVLLIVLALLVIAFTAVINFTNFMDGMDGLVGGCMALAIAATAFSLNASWSSWALVGSLFGFIHWNWSPAKVFMGDVGSTFLGAVFAGMVLQASSWQEAFGYFLLGTPLFADACICVLRRWHAGHRVFYAHRLHLFQRLHQAGWPHARVSITYISATALLAMVMLTASWRWVFCLAVAELLLGVWLDQRVAVPFAEASQS